VSVVVVVVVVKVLLVTIYAKGYLVISELPELVLYSHLIILLRGYFLSFNREDKEFDIIVVYDNKIILVDVKSTHRTSYIEDFIEFIKNREFYSFFPEYQGRELIPIFSSLHLPDEAIKHLSGHNILAMEMAGDTMDIVNPDVIGCLNLQ
jgi:hypothetical protein